MATLRLGTRGSALALVQARTVAALLRERTGTECEIVVIRTSGDRMADARLSEIGGKGLFVKEIEEALLAGTIDLAVHSSKDMPARLPDGLEVRATLPREDPRDALVLPAPAPSLPFDDAVRRLGASPRIGTSSVRRVAQLTAVLPHAAFVPFRGNLDTRLRKLDRATWTDHLAAAGSAPRAGGRIRPGARRSACRPPARGSWPSRSARTTRRRPPWWNRSATATRWMPCTPSARSWRPSAAAVRCRSARTRPSPAIGLRWLAW